MVYINRQIEPLLTHHLKRGKSILLLGPRQTGKSTLIRRIDSDLSLTLVTPSLRQRYEKNPSLLAAEISSLPQKKEKIPLVVLDEIQKVPQLLDLVQDLIDQKLAQFILTGSSARKLRRGDQLNLLPGRVVMMHLDPLILSEHCSSNLETLLLYGTLPGIFQEPSSQDKEVDLKSYVETYLEEEVRAEALVRNVGLFARFLEYAGIESGKIVSFNALSQEIGVSQSTITSYFEILEDCLIAERIDPLTHSQTRKKLTKSSRYLIFDLGVRRLCANEGAPVSLERYGELFEQFVGLELVRLARLAPQRTKILFWRDPDGPEVDWVIEKEGIMSQGKYTPIEVKWTEAPRQKDIRHLKVFLEEYPQAKTGYVICRTPHPLQLEKNIMAIPWQKISELLGKEKTT